MTEVVRNLRIEEYDAFMRFLERSYGFSPGAFERFAPHLYRPSEEMCAASYVVEDEDRIVSHVGLYPIEVVVDGVSIRIGGIGGVGTLPTERGKGHMTRLLYHAIDEMRAQGYPLSWLAGDRQRYNTFGWERAGMACECRFSRRSLDRAGVELVPIEGRFPEDALAAIERLQSLPACHARRPHLARQLQKSGLRVWTAEDGYALVHGTDWGPLSILELVSASGREVGMVRALLDWTGRSEISWEIPAGDGERLARVMPCVAHWGVGGWDMYRVVDVVKLLRAYLPLLSRRAAPLRDFELAIGIREHDRTDLATIAVREGDFQVYAGRHAERHVEWPSVEVVRVLLGGPSVATVVPDELGALLPLPVYVPHLDHV
jgi:predicted N-acetyltransferase YhbS